MKKPLSFFLFLALLYLPLATLKSQDITGRWYSKVFVDEEEFHYLLDIRKNGENYLGFLDLPKEGQFRLRLDSLGFREDRRIFFQCKGLGFEFRGGLMSETKEIKGMISRNGKHEMLFFSKQAQVKRSQLIEQPIPYQSEDVYFYNKDSIRLAGTVTYPSEGEALSAVVLISGSGPQNRDEEILGHKPFLVLADHLTRAGFVVLRYDDRGYGESGGQFRPATSLDYTHDALAAVKYLKNHESLSIDKIGLAGHSEGGNIAPVAATMDPAVQFLILLAAPGTSNLDSYLVSLDLILKEESPETYDRDFPFFESVYKDMAQISDKKTLRNSLQAKFENITTKMDEAELSIYGGKENYIEGMVNYHCSDWYHYYLQFDVTEYLMQLQIPILALNGNKDSSVESKFNLAGIRSTLTKAANKNFETVELDNVNHFFQVSTDSKIENVYFNEETFSKLALKKIVEWMSRL